MSQNMNTYPPFLAGRTSSARPPTSLTAQIAAVERAYDDVPRVKRWTTEGIVLLEQRYLSDAITTLRWVDAHLVEIKEFLAWRDWTRVRERANRAAEVQLDSAAGQVQLYLPPGGLLDPAANDPKPTWRRRSRTQMPSAPLFLASAAVSSSVLAEAISAECTTISHR